LAAVDGARSSEIVLRSVMMVISHMRKYGYTLFGGLRVACAAGVAEREWDDAECGGVTACRFDTDLEGDTCEDETADATVRAE